jgi:pimeloyl-ACP methyl ester carboxylesterase
MTEFCKNSPTSEFWKNAVIAYLTHFKPVTLPVMKPWLRNTLLVLGVVLLTLGVMLFIVSRPFPALETAKAALVSSQTVQIQDTDSSLRFVPQNSNGQGLIFYQGARVAVEAYAVPLRAIAEAGYTVVAPKMPLNFAVFNQNAADAVLAEFPNLTWAIAGHSLGGAMACSYVKNSSRIKTLIFWAAYCDKSFDLSNQAGVRVISIFGQKDGLATPEKILATKVFAPANTEYVEIKGMNHAQFGDYGEQGGDSQPDISNAQAAKQLIAATLEVLGK